MESFFLGSAHIYSGVVGDQGERKQVQEVKDMKIALFNGVVVTTNGLYRVSDILPEDARALVFDCGFVSAIGHKATAEVMSAILGLQVPMNRIQYRQEVGQKAIVLKLNQRPPEGRVLDRQQMQEIGYSLKLIERLE